MRSRRVQFRVSHPTNIFSGNMDIWDVLNAVFAGGVAIGASSDLVAGPGGSIGLGLTVCTRL